MDLLEVPRYPIGRFVYDADADDLKRQAWIDAIRRLPTELRRALAGLDCDALNRTYRYGGWSARQVVHHLADCHMCIFVRFKLALTRHEPEITSFDEDVWARSPDAHAAPIEPSLLILEGLHARWTCLLDSLVPVDFDRLVIHPEAGPQTLDRMLQYYAWHGTHHTAQIASIPR